MVQSTTQQRTNWAPPCKPKGDVFLDAYRAKDMVFQAHSYPHNRSYTGCHACRKITGGSGYSLHAFGPGTAFTHWCGTRVSNTALAEDVNASQNPYGPRLVTDRPRAMVDDMLAIRTNSGHQVWAWGGYYRNNKDGMHDEIVCTPAQLATGIDWTTVRGATEEDDMAFGPDEAERLARIEKMLDDNRWNFAGLKAVAQAVDALDTADLDDEDTAALAGLILAGIDPKAIAKAVAEHLPDYELVKK